MRHYHARGLLPEPPRDPSGYRRYDAQAAVDLIRIKTLADAGVPLARVKELLHAEPAEFAAAIDEIDDRLRGEIGRLQQHRKQIAKLAAGDSLALPASVVEYLERLRAIGMSERAVGVERDGWILVTAHTPEHIEEWVSVKMADLDDDEYRDFYLRFDEASSWDAHDPRLVELADAMYAYFRRIEARYDPAFTASADAAFDQPLVALLDSQPGNAAPAWKRLRTLLEERGWTGWTRSPDTEEGRPERS